jgi:1-aminocyclopropane-1-carboxylate deaminase/D-cysteine desulfhydrase-like pyridoxal-dependent ACC family enzyme
MSDRRAELANAIACQKRLKLAALPTPLHFASRLSAALDHEVWIKRDDLTGLALGGNKARKLEFIFGAAEAGIDTVVTMGAQQSNHARTVAAAARIAGWECHLVLAGKRPHRPSGNLTLDVALGTNFHFTGTDEWEWGALETAGAVLTEELTRAGKRVLLIPMGGSTPQGAVGFVAAYLELLKQCHELEIDPEALVHATSTGGTQAGLDFARNVIGSGPNVIGVGVAKTSKDLQAEVVELEHGLSKLLGLQLEAQPNPTVLPGYMGEVYAEPTDGGSAAFKLLSQAEAILTDSVYTAKALHAVVELCRKKTWRKGSPLIFWHTGGVPAIFSDSSGIIAWD